MSPNWRRCATPGCETEILEGERCSDCEDADECADSLEDRLALALGEATDGHQ